MKKVLWAVGFLGLLACLYVVTGADTKTSQMYVGANIPDEVWVTSPTLLFGDLDIQNASYANGEIYVRAPIGTVYRIAVDAGQHYNGNRTLMDEVGGTDQIIYFLYKEGMSEYWGDAGYGDTFVAGTPVGPITGTGASQTHPIYAIAHPYQGKPPGTYTDRPIATVHY